MTTLRKSDAQLDAEARGRVVSPVLRTARDVLVEWRVALDREGPQRTTTTRPPELVEKVDGVRIPVIDPGTRVGVTMAGPFLRYLEGSAGRMFPGHDALLAWDRKCRRDHARWADHRGRPVCAEIAWYVLRDRTTLLFAAETTNVSYARAENLLGLAINWMARQQRRWMRDIDDVPVRHEREGAEHCEACRGEVAG